MCFIQTKHSLPWSLSAQRRTRVKSLRDQSSYKSRLRCLISNVLYRRTERSGRVHCYNLLLVHIRTERSAGCYIYWIGFFYFWSFCWGWDRFLPAVAIPWLVWDLWDQQWVGQTLIWREEIIRAPIIVLASRLGLFFPFLRECKEWLRWICRFFVCFQISNSFLTENFFF